jgi:myo-inositol-1(or 4)-monophosphatase
MTESKILRTFWTKLEIGFLSRDIVKIVNEVLARAIVVEYKSAEDPVTKIDYEISNLIKEWAQINATNHCFYSEEEHSDLTWPAVVLDPIDGTRELIAGTGEVAVSLAIMNDEMLSSPLNQAWVFNPFTGFQIMTGEMRATFDKHIIKTPVGMVSVSDWKKGLIGPRAGVELVPVGSIAFKLGLLAAGACDFVYSQTPKNLWDIAAGTILCSERGIHLFDGKGDQIERAQARLDGPLLWCRPQMKERLLGCLSG